MEVT
jgi:hypothetical protein